MRLDAFGICLLKQTASSAQSVTSPSKIEGFREFEADLSALFWDLGDEPYGREQNQGITVEIGGDTTKLQTALKGVNTEIRNTQS